jgi:hypothetical protein
MKVSPLLSEFNKVGSVGLSGHGEVLEPISGSSAKMKISVNLVWRSSG